MNRRARLFILGAVVMLLMAVTVALALAEGPGADGAPQGRIAFQSNRSGDHEIYTMNADGSGLTRLTFNPGNDAEPSWSPDGQWIAFFSRRYEQQGEIHKIRADGTEETRLTFNTRFDWYPSWSPDGQWIAFASDRDMGPSDGTWGLMIYKMRSDGSDVIQLTENPAADSRPSWSPDGQWIAFHSNRDGHWSNYNIYKMRPDGSEETRLTDHSAADSMPRWSPDSQWICFGTCRDGNYEVYKMRADGTEQTRLTDHPAEDAVCSWSPDGQYIVFHSKRSGNNELWIIRADGEGSPIQLTDNPAEDLGPDWWGSPVLEATADIKPNVLNFKSKGRWVTAYIELPQGYDVADIDVGTVLLEDTLPAAPRPTAVGDYDQDGVPDLMVKFRRQPLIAYLKANGLTSGKVELTVTGYVDSAPFEGDDIIRVRRRWNPRRPHR